MGKGTDPKLYSFIRSYLEDWKKSRPPTEDAVIDGLMSAHREYQRKPQGPLRKMVGKVLRQLLERADKESLVAGLEDERLGDMDDEADGLMDDEEDEGRGGENGQSNGKKRKRAGGRPGEGSSDEDFEQEAKDRERVMDVKGHNLLNDSLSATYRAKALLANKAEQANAEQGPPPADKKGAKPKKQLRRKRTLEPPPPADEGAPAASVVVERPTARYADLAGIEQVLQDVRELIEYPLRYPEVYRHLGVEPPRGILLHGPPGCGKTLLANAVAGELGVAFLRISAPEIVSGMSGESEQKVRDLFQTAIESAPAIVFIDEVDAITQKRDTSQRGMERRIVAQLLTCMDSLSLENTNGHPVLVMGATNRPDSLDSALRRAGRFDREIALGVPDQEARQRILDVMTRKMRLSGDFDLSLIAKKTPGFVGADLASLTKEAAVIAINRIFTSLTQAEALAKTAHDDAPASAVEAVGADDAMAVEAVTPEAEVQEEGGHRRLSPETLSGLAITMDDFLQAVSKVQPSSKREGFAAVPGVTWADVGALASVREELAMSIIEPIANPERFTQLGLAIPAGVLLFGPPGCGKTLLAKAIANESGANFISVKGPELLDKYVGESERAVRQVFTRARASSPCIIFFDELDALCPRRGAGGDGGSGVSERVVNQLLTEMDGLEGRRNVFVIAATNRPELIDSAMLRPGRLDKLLYVPLPTPGDRVSILRALCRRIALDPTIDLQSIGSDVRAEGYSGADLAALVHEAGIAVLKEVRRRELEGQDRLEGPLTIQALHFDAAFASVLPSVSARDQRRYLQTRTNLSRARAAPTATSANATTTNAAAAADKPPQEGHAAGDDAGAGEGQGDRMDA